MLQPLVWVLLLVLISFWIKSVLWTKRLRLAGVIILLLFSNPALLKLSLYAWEIHAVKDEDVSHYDAALVLGGMIEWDNDAQRISCRRGVDRIWQGMRLYKNGKVDKLLISGDSGYVFGRDLKEAERLKQELLIFDFPKEDIFVETNSRNTYENILFSKSIIDSMDWNRVLLITSARHMRRARAICEKLNVSVDVFPTDQDTGNELCIYWDEYLVPSSGVFSGWTGLIKEVVGYIVYDIKGYL